MEPMNSALVILAGCAVFLALVCAVALLVVCSRLGELQRAVKKLAGKELPALYAPDIQVEPLYTQQAAPAAPAVEPRGDGKPAQDPSKCVYCTICARKCPGEALTVDRAAKTWTLDEDKCVMCGTCADVCPKNAIVI